MFFKTLQNPTSRQLIGIIISAFLFTFSISRLYVYLVLGHWAPNLFLTIKGVHIHHFTYGVVILGITGLYLILKRPEVNSRVFHLATWFYGIGLGLTFDEFGMWIRLEDDYWIRQSYDAVIIVILLLLNIAYYRSVIAWIKEFLISILHLPARIINWRLDK